MTGAQVARTILNRNGLADVAVKPVAGVMSDHYDPRTREVCLSEGVYNSTSVSAISIAAHEVGHALQHAEQYAPLQIRASILPVANLGSTAAFPLFFIGLLLRTGFLMDLGIFFFAGALLFHLVTLPVEYNASSRALKQIQNGLVYQDEEIAGSRKVLNAAALTYVAATLMALMQLIRLILIRNSRD
jgi:Zn-dependent membrane protease YugP